MQPIKCALGAILYTLCRTSCLHKAPTTWVLRYSDIRAWDCHLAIVICSLANLEIQKFNGHEDARLLSLRWRAGALWGGRRVRFWRPREAARRTTLDAMSGCQRRARRWAVHGRRWCLDKSSRAIVLSICSLKFFEPIQTLCRTAVGTDDRPAIFIGLQV